MATNEQERVYNTIAEKIARKQLTEVSDIIRALRPVYPSDDQFRAAFAGKQIRTTTSRIRQVARYILFEIERHLSGSVFDDNSDKYTIEHVLPEHPTEGWTAFSDDQADRCIYRIGNMTPLADGPNREIGNAAYDQKKDVFKKSDFEITRRIAVDHAEWSPERIASRQQWMAAQATAIWRLAEI